MSLIIQDLAILFQPNKLVYIRYIDIKLFMDYHNTFRKNVRKLLFNIKMSISFITMDITLRIKLEVDTPEIVEEKIF